jgi:hypothetical protein
VQHCPILVASLLELILDDLLGQSLEHLDPPVHAPVFLEKAHLEDLQAENKVPQRSLLEYSIGEELAEPHCN